MKGQLDLIAQVLDGLAGMIKSMSICCRHSERGRVKFTSVKVGGVTVGGDIVSSKIPVGFQATLSIQPVDAQGNPALVDGVPSWDQSGHFDLMPAEDGMSAIVRPHGALGSGQVTVTVDADLGEGVRTISGLLDLEVVAGEAASVSIAMGPLEKLP